MKKVIFGVVIIFGIILYSCNNGDVLGPVILEPITFIQPDSTTVSAFPGTTINIEAQLTTDRLIDSLVIRFHIDSLSQGFNPDTDPLYVYENVKWPVEDNIQLYQGTYTVPANLNSFDVVRLIFNLRAKERFYQKTLKINVQ
ncbi:MAG: hypothetical protein HKN92_05255 [Chitinophagales bacterium]|nr:hypothetical protein [Chitinophagales bacterium]